MRRRDFLAAATAALGLPSRAAAQRGYQLVQYREYARCLPDYLRRLAAEAYQRRNQALDELTTPEAIQARQAWVRQTFWRLVGGRPEPSPLNVRTTGEFSRPGYRVEKLIYESQPGLYIAANLYVPTSASPPFPGVLFQMGHSLNGKAAALYQYCCQGLAKLGFLVLAFDPMGQGERTYYPQKDGVLTRLPSADDEHTLPGKQLLLAGDTSTRMQTWDAVRSLDVLAAHPLADSKRLASTGNSGGGTLTMMLAAVDDRLAAAAACCPNTENLAWLNFNPPGSTDDAEQNFLYSGPQGFDRWDLLYPLVPKPLLITVSARDFFGTYSPSYLENGRQEYFRLHAVYRTLAQPGAVAWYESPLPHGMNYDTRLRVYNWFRRWLQNGLQPLEREPDVKAEDDRVLWATDTGNVTRSLGGLTPWKLARRHAESIRTPERPAELERILDVDPPAAPQPHVVSRAASRACDAYALEAQVTPEVAVPAWLFVPPGAPQGGSLLVVLEPQGRSSRWSEDSLYQALAAKQCIVCAADVRGIGDLSPEFGRGSPRYTRSHQEEEHYAWASLMLGKSLLGQRVADLRALAAALEALPQTRGRRILLAARDKMTVPALFAAAIDTRIAGLYLAGHLLSYRSIFDVEQYNVPFANFLPDVLRYADLPQLAASLAPRRLVLAGCVDAAGASAAPEAVRALYKDPHITVRGPAWDEASLLEFASPT